VASIQKHKTADGGTSYRVRWKDESRRSHEAWARTLADARQIKLTAESDTAAGLSYAPGASAERLNSYFERWLPARTVQGRPLTPATSIGYTRLWRRVIAPTIGRKALRAITPEVVREWHGSVVAERGADQGAKAYRLLRATLNTAVDDNVIKLNPCRLRGGGMEHAAERPLLGAAAVLELADQIDTRLRALVLTAGLGGLRSGELTGLHREDVDAMHSTVTVRRQAQELPGGRVESRPKTAAGVRTVVVPRVAMEALTAHMESYTGPGRDDVVFTSPEGGPLRRAWLSREWRRAVRATGLPVGLRVHDLRHASLTMAAQSGATLREVMSRAGHASMAASIRYQHAASERDREIASAIDAMVDATDVPARAAVV
jgi:integrase